MPGAQLLERAALHGAKVIQTNPDLTLLDNTAHFNFSRKVGEFMPTLVIALSDFLEKF